MTDWVLVLTLLSVAAVLSCFRFAGCTLPVEGIPIDTGPSPLPLYGPAILAEGDSLVAYWRLGEPPGTGPGNDAKDEKGGHGGEYRSTTLMAGTQSPATLGVLKAGQLGLVLNEQSQKSVRVDGGYVQVKYSPDLNPSASDSFSVEAWVHPEWKAEEVGLFRCVVASREDTGGNRYGYILYAGPKLSPDLTTIIDSTMFWQAWVGDGTTWQMLWGPTVDVDVTTYLIMTYDGVTKTLALDAVNENSPTYQPLGQTVTYSPNPPPPPGVEGKPLFIGMGAPEFFLSPSSVMYPFLGRLQEIAFYNKVLTTEQVAKHLGAAGNF